MIEIRRLQRRDLENVAVLLSELGYPTTPEEASQRFAALDAGDVLFVAVVADGVVGFASVHSIPLVHRSSEVLRITAFVVSGASRRRGIGRALLGACEDEARRRGAERIEVTSGSARHDAHAFYASRGFSVEGVRFSKKLQPREGPS